MTFVLKEMMFMEWKRFAAGTLKRKWQKIMFVFRFLLSEMKLLILASVLAFYSLSRYSETRVTMCVHIPNHAMGTIFLILLKKLCQFEQNAVLERKYYFRDFYIYDFHFKRDEVHDYLSYL